MTDLKNSPYANIDREYVQKYMDASKYSKEFAEKVPGPNYSKGYLSGWLGIPGDMLNALTAWAVSGIPDPELRQQAKTALSVKGTEDIGEMMGADVESGEFMWGSIGLPGLDDMVQKSPYLSMVLFHGSRHKFSKFKNSPDVIGTGSGSQAFGHGLYFGENPGTGIFYQRTTAKPPPVPRSVMNALQRNDYLGFDGPKQALNNIRRHPDWAKRWDVDPKDVPAIEKHLDGAESGSHLYEVEVPDEVTARMLDWDAPISEQPENVRKAFHELRDKFDLQNADGHTMYRDIQSKMPHDDPNVRQQMTSELLSEMGIPGNRYWDGGSRAKGEGTRNVVVFDHNDITSVKRDGELVYEAVK